MRSDSMSRRRFNVLAGAAALIPAIRPALAGAQTPAASPATAGNLLAVISFEADTVPTMFGDVTVTQNPQCVITLTVGALDPALAIGVVPVGATASSNGESAAGYPEYSAKVPGDLTYVGGWGELDIEQIVALAPDLILGDRYLNSADHTLCDTLSRIAIVVASEEIQVADASALQQCGNTSSWSGVTRSARIRSPWTRLRSCEREQAVCK